MSNIGSINTNFDLPTLPNDPTPADSLNFEKSLMIFQEGFDASKTAISTLGDANSGAAGTKPQAS